MDNRIVFSFNKASIGNPDVPPWIIKSHDETHYVWHLISIVGFSTKETPESPHTQGSLQFRGTLELVQLDGKLQAKVTP